MPRDVITIKYSDSPGAIPSASYLEPGELALNRSQGLIYYKDVDGTVRPIGDVSGAVVKPGGPHPEPGIGVFGNEFFVDATVVRVDPGFVPDNPTPGSQTIKGNVVFPDALPTTLGNTLGTLNQQLVNVYTLNQQKLERHQNTSELGLVTGSVFQYDGAAWVPVTVITGGTY